MAEAKEIELLCNNLRCRVALNTLGEAVVTNCSHIFCGPCANSLIGTERICPACNAHLPGSDEITTISLSPHTEWKASVLSGLSPGLILEIAQRAMSFWTYQTSQLSAFQEYVVNQAKERVHGLEAQLHQAEEGRQAQERENQKLREKLDHQQAHLYKISDELKTVKDELNRVSTQKRQLLLKQPLGNAMDLQEAVNGQLFFDNEDDMAGMGAGYGGTSTNRAPFMATPRGSARRTVTPSTDHRRSDPGSKPPHVISGPLGPIPHPQSRSNRLDYGASAFPLHTASTPRTNQWFGGATPVYDTRTATMQQSQAMKQSKMRDNLAQMQKRVNGGVDTVRTRQPLGSIDITNAGNARMQGGSGFGTKGGGLGAVPLRSTNNLQQRRYAM